MKKVDSSDRSNFPSIVDKSHISLGRSIKLSNLNVPEVVKKLPPNLCSHSITNGQSDFVIFVLFTLYFEEQNSLCACILECVLS